MDLGSSGVSGHGGGVIRLAAERLLLNGVIRADAGEYTWRTLEEQGLVGAFGWMLAC